MMIQSISPEALAESLGSESPPLVVDVRTSEEYELANLDSAILIPMDEISTRWHELPEHQDIVLICHHGIRSMHVAMFLSTKGLNRLFNLTGGIDAWSLKIDPEVPRY